jgi:Gpi18-like mannosyltransferase
MKEKKGEQKEGTRFWRLVLLGVGGLRAITLAAVAVGFAWLPFKSSFPFAEIITQKYSFLVWPWANFDGFHYLTIAKDGYVFGQIQAYFPFYSLIVREVSRLIGDYLLSGLLVSHLAFLGAWSVGYRLLRLDYSHRIASQALVALSLFPTAFFFFSFYTESLFLLLVFLVFYWWRQGKTWQAGLAGACAAATRIVGIFLVPALLYEVWQAKGRSPKTVVAALVPSLGLLGYMGYLQWRFGNFLLFTQVQAGFGAGRTTDKLILFYQVLWRYGKMILTVDPRNLIYFALWLELLTAIIFLGLLVWAWRQGVRKSYVIYSFLAYLLPTLTGTFSSMPRYVLVLFPAFIIIGQVKHRSLFRLWLVISALLLFISTALFARGYWVA